MNIKGTVAICAACAAMAAGAMTTQATFDAEDREALRAAAEEVQLKLKTARTLDGKAITVLPVKGDRDGYFERLLVGAFVGADKTCVIGNDEKKDARFKMILREIKWDERQKTLKSVDPKTIDELGKLKSTQVFVECRVMVHPDAKGRNRVVEADILAYAVESKAYIWTLLVNSKNERGTPMAEESPAVGADNNAVRVKVAVEKGNAVFVASAAYTALCNELGKAGYVVNGKEEPDVLVSVVCAREIFDQSGEWIRYRGHLGVRAEVCGANARHLAQKSVIETGARGLGEVEAERNLAEKTSVKIGEWVRDVLSRADLGIRIVMATLKTGKVVSADELKIQKMFFESAKAAKGVRSVHLVKQDSATGTFTFRVVFDADQFGDGFMNEMVAEHPDWDLSLAR